MIVETSLMSKPSEEFIRKLSDSIYYQLALPTGPGIHRRYENLVRDCHGYVHGLKIFGYEESIQAHISEPLLDLQDLKEFCFCHDSYLFFFNDGRFFLLGIPASFCKTNKFDLELLDYYDNVICYGYLWCGIVIATPNSKDTTKITFLGKNGMSKEDIILGEVTAITPWLHFCVLLIHVRNNDVISYFLYDTTNFNHSKIIPLEFPGRIVNSGTFGNGVLVEDDEGKIHHYPRKNDGSFDLSNPKVMKDYLQYVDRNIVIDMNGFFIDDKGRRIARSTDKYIGGGFQNGKFIHTSTGLLIGLFEEPQMIPGYYPLDYHGIQLMKAAR